MNKIKSQFFEINPNTLSLNSNKHHISIWIVQRKYFLTGLNTPSNLVFNSKLNVGGRRPKTFNLVKHQVGGGI